MEAEAFEDMILRQVKENINVNIKKFWMEKNNAF